MSGSSVGLTKKDILARRKEECAASAFTPAITSPQGYFPSQPESCLPEPLEPTRFELVANQPRPPAIIGIVFLNSSMYWSLFHKVQVQKTRFITQFEIYCSVNFTP